MAATRLRPRGDALPEYNTSVSHFQLHDSQRIMVRPVAVMVRVVLSLKCLRSDSSNSMLKKHWTYSRKQAKDGLMNHRPHLLRSSLTFLLLVGFLALVGCEGATGPLGDASTEPGQATQDVLADANGAGDGALALVPNAADNNVSVIDVAARSEVATVDVGDFPSAVAVTPDRTLALVANVSGDNVSVVDIVARNEVATVDAGDSPTQVAITPDGALALVVNNDDDNVSVIDIAARSEVATVNVGLAPKDVAIFRPLTPEEQVEDLEDEVEALADAGALSGGEAVSLQAKLDAALASLERGQQAVACNQLEAFIHQVEAFVRGGKLTAEEGQSLIDRAQALIDELCG